MYSSLSRPQFLAASSRCKMAEITAELLRLLMNRMKQLLFALAFQHMREEEEADDVSVDL